MGAVEDFFAAVRSGHADTVEHMLQADPALVHANAEHHAQPIHMLDGHFNHRVLDLLLRHGADINARNDHGMTLLHLLSDAHAVPVVLKAGADLEALDGDRRTPLIEQSTDEDHTAVVAALVAAGADVHARDRNGKTALRYAEEREDDEVIEILTKAGAT